MPIQTIRREAGHVTRLLTRLWYERRTFAVEAYLAIQAMTMGAWLLLPGHTFDSLPDVYFALAMLMPEWAWGLAFFAIGAVHLWALERGHLRVRLRVTVALVFVWLIVAAAVTPSRPLRMAIPLYWLPVVAGFWVYHAQTLNGAGKGRRE